MEVTTRAMSSGNVGTPFHLARGVTVYNVVVHNSESTAQRGTMAT